MNILVTHRSNGNGKLVKGRPVIQQVTQVYDNGQVKTESGDIWSVKPCISNNASLEAVE